MHGFEDGRLLHRGERFRQRGERSGELAIGIGLDVVLGELGEGS